MNDGAQTLWMTVVQQCLGKPPALLAQLDLLALPRWTILHCLLPCLMCDRPNPSLTHNMTADVGNKVYPLAGEGTQAPPNNSTAQGPIKCPGPKNKMPMSPWALGP